MPRRVYLTREQARQVDRIAIEDYGIPGIVLMENAARAASGVALSMLGNKRGGSRRASILCGGGNNGGDGYAIARHLHNAGVKVEVFAVSEPSKLQGDAAINFGIVEHMLLPVIAVSDQKSLDAAARRWGKADLLVDAILGTGFSGALRPELVPVIEELNRHRAGQSVLSIDLPSGLDCETGTAAKPTVLADKTVTFVAEKIGFKTDAAKRHLGAVEVAQIGTPPELLKRVLTS